MQQSPALGLRMALQLVHSWKNRQESPGISISSAKPHSGQVTLELKLVSILTSLVRIHNGCITKVRHPLSGYGCMSARFPNAGTTKSRADPPVDLDAAARSSGLINHLLSLVLGMPLILKWLLSSIFLNLVTLRPILQMKLLSVALNRVKFILFLQLIKFRKQERTIVRSVPVDRSSSKRLTRGPTHTVFTSSSYRPHDTNRRMI